MCGISELVPPCRCRGLRILGKTSALDGNFHLYNYVASLSGPRVTSTVVAYERNTKLSVKASVHVVLRAHHNYTSTVFKLSNSFSQASPF